MLKLFTNFEYTVELTDVVKLFANEVELCDNLGAADVSVVESRITDGYIYKAQCDLQTDIRQFDFTESTDDLQIVRLRKRYAKVALYNVLSAVIGKVMPWGSLTGIRPTKLARQLVKEGGDWQKIFAEPLGVSDSKIKLVSDILTVQGNICNVNSDSADLYVGIPFCVTRCSYCSFTSGELERLKKYVEPYVDALCQDIQATIKFAKTRGIALRNVYFGGGTPTSLTSEQLDKIMSSIDFTPKEYTVEAGRPDTVTAEKLSVFKKHGVDRISINPQTFNQRVLDVIGRRHTVDDIYCKYGLAKEFGFTINMDFIAGLPTETYDMFCASIDKAIEISPDNVTVHTLALKRGSILKEQSYTSSEQDVSAMVEYAHKRLYENGYVPYYMYRQKYMADNLENVGFCKPNKQCLYNIGIMEETTNILACGTNAISKRIFSADDRIERSANAKDVITYIERNKDYLSRKFELFSR